MGISPAAESFFLALAIQSTKMIFNIDKIDYGMRIYVIIRSCESPVADQAIDSSYKPTVLKEECMSIIQELIAQREALDKQIEEARRLAATTAIAQIKQLIAEHELTAADCGFKLIGAVPQPVPVRKAVAAKYRGPNGETWSGRGKAPNWLVNLELNGQHRNSFLVA